MSAGRNQFNPENFVTVAETVLQVPILFHIVHVHNISKSRLNQLEEWKELDDPNSVSVDRVNKKKVITHINVDEPEVAPTKDVFRLTLQDNFGNLCYGYEMEPLPFLRTKQSPMVELGGGLVVSKGTTVMSGVLMLRTTQCTYVGVDDEALANGLNSNIVGKYIRALSREN